ncbi:hypothetical protein LAWI1_G004083, partial [Lachnellula willkommii]
MPPIRTGRRGYRLRTPPLELQPKIPGNQPYRTPHRSTVFACHLMAEACGSQPGSKDTKEAIHKVFKIAPSSQEKILGSGEVRSLHNQPDLGPDPRGRPKAIPSQDTSAIGDFLDDPNLPLDRRSQPWRDLAEDAGGNELSNLKRSKQAAKKTKALLAQSAKRSTQARLRVLWCILALLLRPRSWRWWNTAFCDEFHFGIGPQTTKHIKRRKGRKFRYAPYMVHRKEVTSKDTKAKAREDEHLKLLNCFVVIRYNYRRAIPYRVANLVGKMTAEAYIEQARGLTLVQDADLAHSSKKVAEWARQHKMRILTLPGVSPDLSIIETMANTVKRLFHSKKCSIEEGAMSWFMEVWDQEMDQNTIQRSYN